MHAQLYRALSERDRTVIKFVIIAVAMHHGKQIGPQMFEMLSSPPLSAELFLKYDVPEMIISWLVGLRSFE